MNERPLIKIVVLGALTGMRSTAGLATLAMAGGGPRRSVMALAAAGEMLADKTSLIRKRLPLSRIAGGLVEDAVVLGVASRYA